MMSSALLKPHSLSNLRPIYSPYIVLPHPTIMKLGESEIKSSLIVFKSSSRDQLWGNFKTMASNLMSDRSMKFKF
jgi:hypothetical protein